MWQYIKCQKCKYYESNCKNTEGTTAHTCFGFEEKGQEQTNFKFMRSCTIEEMAKVFANATYSSAMMWAEIIALPKEDEVRKWERWLKQPRHEKDDEE